MARKLPKPFKRPSIEIGGVPREWRTVLAEQVSAGDNLLGVGMVTEVDHHLFGVDFHISNGTVATVPAAQLVNAFTRGGTPVGNGG